jgi:multiple sugar transport system permease protein/raffinose/stachyose/melibiose transport system permease protein
VVAVRGANPPPAARTEETRSVRAFPALEKRPVPVPHTAAGPEPPTRTRRRLLPLAHRQRRRRGWRAYLFLAPSILILLGFTVYPIVESAWMSLHDWSFLSSHHKFIGFGNYETLWHDSRFWNALRNTLIFSAVAVPLQVGLGLALAVALSRNTLVNKLMRSIFFFPVIASLATMAIVWKFLLDPTIGLIPHLLTSVGLPRENFLQSLSLALPTVIAVSVWKNVGFTMVILLAALQGIPHSIYEAAAIDGAGRWASFRHLTLPSLRQSLLFATIISVIASLQLFDQVYVMTGGGPLFHTETLVTYMYQQGFQNYRSGYAASIAWVLFLMIMLASAVQLRLFRYRDVD